MKNPNGYGSVYKLNGKRRKPWIALTAASSVSGSLKKKREVIGYFSTRAEAMIALAAWNESPQSFKPTTAEEITLRQLYEEYIKLQRFENLSKKAQDTYRGVWKSRLSVLGDYKVKDLRTAHFQAVITGAYEKGLSVSSVQKTKVFSGMLCDYAVQMDIVPKNYASFTMLPKMEEKEKIPFSDIDLKKLEEAAQRGFMYADLILIMCYTGWRINEFLALTRFDWDEENHTLRGGEKTDAGKNRIVPVCDKVMPYLRKWLDKNGPRIVCKERYGELVPVTDKYFRNKWYYPTLEALGLPRLTPHATRHTFASLLYREGIDKWGIQKLMGQVSDTATKRYTHIEIEQLKKAVNSI